MFLKTARNRHNRLTAGQWQTSHITYCWELYTVNDLALSQEMHQGHTKLPVRSPWKLAFCRGQWDASYTKHSAKVSEEKRFQHGRESNTASPIKQLISGEIVLMRMSKPKANTLNICCDVFVRNCQFVMTFMLALL